MGVYLRNSMCSSHKKIIHKIKQDLWKDEPVKEKWVIRRFVDNNILIVIEK